MICPNCKAEYRDGYFACRDCGVELIPDLPPQTAMPPRHHPHPVEYAPLLSVENGDWYETVRAHLEAAGIDYIPRPNVIGRLSYPITIEVRKDQDEIASDLLAELDLSLTDPFQASEVPEGEETPGRTRPTLEVPEEPAVPQDGPPAVGLEIEAAVVRDGRYLVIGAEEAADGDVSLPGGPVASIDEAYASDLDRLPHTPPGLSAMIRRADGLRLAKGW